MTIIGSIIVTGVGTAIGSYFQNRNAKNRRLAARREREVAAANDIFNTVSKRMDLLLHHMWQVYKGYTKDLHPDLREKRKSKYMTVYQEWESSQNLEFARIQQYFHKKAFTYFHDKIWKRFLDMHKQLEFLFLPLKKGQKSPKENLERDQNGDSYFYLHALQIGAAIEHFNRSIIELIQEEKVGILIKEKK